MLKVKYGRSFSRVDVQVFIITMITSVIACSLIFLFCYKLTYGSMLTDLEHRASNIHDHLEHYLSQDMFTDLNHKSDHTNELYIESYKLLEETRGATGVRYLYTAKMTEDGQFIYLVDGLPTDSNDFRFVGDAIESECIPDMKRALSGEDVFPDEINNTTWGPVFISYFPMHRGEEVVGVLGIEFDASDQYNTYLLMRITVLAVLLLAGFASAVISVLVFRRISNPMYKDYANTDMLTGLKNRNAFDVDLHNRNRTADKSPIAIFSFDVDGLKSVNDLLGHEKGDEYLKLCSAILTRAIDVKKILYRIGGDEFAAIVPNAEEIQLSAIKQRIYMLAAEESGRREYNVGISAGYAFYDSNTDASLSDALKRADDKMYEDKKIRKSNHN